MSNKSKGTQKPAQDFIDKSIVFHLITILSNSNDGKLPPLVSNYYAHMNLTNSSDEILSSLLQVVDEISEQDILQTYSELLEGDKKENRYIDYKIQLEKDLLKTKSISSRTLSRLFKTVLPALFVLTNEEKSKLASELSDSRFDFINAQSSSLGE